MRVTFDIPDEAHRQIKTLAAFSGMTMKAYILSRALGSGSDETTDAQASGQLDETEYLLASPANATRLEAAIKSDPQKRARFSSLEELRNALGV